MKARLFLVCATTMLIAGWASAQSPAPAAGSDPALDPAKVAEFQKRFEQGYALEQQGQLVEARAVYDGILAEEPKAKRSLLEAGRISLKLGELEKADAYLEKLHALVPDFPEATELLIQVNQALKRDVKVLRLITEFTELHASGRVPEFAQSLNFVREQVRLDPANTVIFAQYFNYTVGPNIVWKAQVLDAAGKVKRQLVLIYDVRGTQDLRQKDPKFANSEQFLLVEDVLKNGQVGQIDAYFQMFSLPEYKKVRNTMLAIIGGVYKPVYSQAVDGSAPTH